MRASRNKRGRSNPLIPSQQFARCYPHENGLSDTASDGGAPLKEFNPTKFQSALSTMNVRRDIVRVSSSGLDEYCSGRYDQCMRDCRNSSTPFRIGHRKYMSTRAHCQGVVVLGKLHGGFG